MQVRVLGCSGSIAARCHTTAFLVDDDILLDAGSGVGELRLDELARIEHVFISHSHLDHVLGIPLLADSVISLRKAPAELPADGLPSLIAHAPNIPLPAPPRLRPIHVHALPETLQALRQHIFNGIIWPDFTRLPSAEQPLIVFHEIAIGQVIDLPGRGQTTRRLEVLPAAHTVPACGFAVHGHPGRTADAPPETDPGWWVYTGDTGPNPALWITLAGRPIAHLIIETAFGDDERHLAAISGHLAPHSLAAELTQLDGSVSVHITHTKPGELPAVLSQIRALDSRHRIEPLREGQVFAV
ncbi:MAG: MBL fold metallo-hydrolase [Pseudomonadota bacterium]